jgi:hypothetical protein
MRDHGYCHCENSEHQAEQEAVGCIHLIDLDDDPQFHGYKVCPACLGEFIVGVCLDRDSDLRLAFRIHPVGATCP